MKNGKAGKEGCLVPYCKDQPRARGLCVTHYQTARKLINNKKTTDKKLVATGKMKATKFFVAADWFLGR